MFLVQCQEQNLGRFLRIRGAVDVMFANDAMDYKKFIFISNYDNSYHV